MHTGRVEEILEKRAANGQPRQVYLTIRKFETGGRHAHLCMPTIHKPEEEVFLLADVKVRITV